MLTEDELQEILDREQAATPGPWTVAFNGAMRSAWAVQKANSSSAVLHLEPQKNIDLDESTHQVDADLDFVQYARTDIPALLGEIWELKQQLAETQNLEESLKDTQVSLMDIAERYEKLHNALEFYGNLANYKPSPSAPNPGDPVRQWIGNDLGRCARAALGQLDNPPATETEPLASEPD